MAERHPEVDVRQLWLAQKGPQVKIPDSRTFYLQSYDVGEGTATFMRYDGTRKRVVRLPKFFIELLKAEYTRGQNDALVKVRKALGI